MLKPLLILPTKSNTKENFLRFCAGNFYEPKNATVTKSIGMSILYFFYNPKEASELMKQTIVRGSLQILIVSYLV